MTSAALNRLETAIARIERATESRAGALAALRRRNVTLKARIGEAIAALDEVIARGEEA